MTFTAGFLVFSIYTNIAQSASDAIYSTLVTSSTSQRQPGGGGRQWPLSAFSRICKFKNKSSVNSEHEGETFPERTIHFTSNYHSLSRTFGSKTFPQQLVFKKEMTFSVSEREICIMKTLISSPRQCNKMRKKIP